ncbi:unnamed protein product [Darwinula stevensoni]|uniref:Phosphotriesterase-related protein n=1 Tax=Darwinula stevensoni TaxID=69355 RepID=A0A7R9AAB8_9CRUS|nr:unnamed protein product [Darwinula stevensoni]CAG0898026.1 unnamed protein product [Darwinula stevensoni]
MDPRLRIPALEELPFLIDAKDFEKRVIEAAAEVQQQTGCPVNFHPGRHIKAPYEVLRIFGEAGGDVRHMVMSHLERTINDEGQLLEFAELGSYLEFDLFGVEVSNYQLNEEIDMPSDAQRIQRIWQLVDEGYEKSILVSHDIYSRHRLRKYGGHGYGHILENVLPKMLNRGLSQSVIHSIITRNPRQLLTWK